MKMGSEHGHCDYILDKPLVSTWDANGYELEFLAPQFDENVYELCE